MKFINIIFCLVLIFSCGETNRSAIQKIGTKIKPSSEQYPGLFLKGRINPDTSYLELVFKQYGLINIRTLDNSFHVDLRYASENNFTMKNVYDGLRNAYFPCEVANRLCNAQYALKKHDSTLSLCILDAARPLHIQQMMWDSLRMPADRKFNYLAAPYSVSLHNYGCAVDITIIDLKTGRELDMGSAFDEFSKLSEPVYEQVFHARGELSDTVLYHRRLLRHVMKRAGFNPINSEWWHFNYCSKETATARFALIK